MFEKIPHYDITFTYYIYFMNLALLKELSINNKLTILVGTSGTGKSFLKDSIKKEIVENGYAFLESDTKFIWGTPADMVECRKYLILAFLKHLAEKLFKTWSYDTIHNPSEPMLLTEEMLQKEYDIFLTETNLPKINLVEIVQTLNELNFMPRCTVLTGWWVREKFFTKLLSVFDEEIENDFKKFFYYEDVK